MITLMYLTFGGDIKLTTFEINDSCSSWWHHNVVAKEKQKKTVFQRKADDIKKTRTCERLRPRCDNTIGQNTALTVVPFRITVSSRSKLVART